MLIRSYVQIRSLEVKAYFKTIKDLHFSGLPKGFDNRSMTRLQGNRYLNNVRNLDTLRRESHCLSVDTMTAERLEVKTEDSTNYCFVEGQYMLAVWHTQPMAIFIELKEVGIIEFRGKQVYCKNNYIIHGRYRQNAGHSVYAVDNNAPL